MQVLDETAVDRLPPQSVEAEQAVLGSMLIDEDSIAEAVEFVNKDSFYKEEHRKIFASIADIYSANRAVDLLTVKEELKSRSQLDEIDGVSYLTFLTNIVPTAANIRHYAKIVREKELLRHLIHTATQIVTESYDPAGEVDSLLDRAERLIFDITSRNEESRTVSIKELVRDGMEVIENLYQNKAHVTGIATGFTDFDAKTAGLQPSDLIVVAGRPSMGKSAFITGMIEHIGLVEKKPVVVFSLEMSRQQLVQRLLCSHARVNMQNVRSGYLSQTDWPKLVTAAGKLSDAPIFIDDSPAISVMELRAKARRLKSAHNIQAIFLDYLQLMQGHSRADNRQHEISEISRSLKALARELNVPLIAVSQLSRAVESRQDHRPLLSDLRESGAIEQDADLVVMLLREEYYNPTEENKGKTEVIIGKQRNGPVGSLHLAFIKEYAKFENLARVEDQ